MKHWRLSGAAVTALCAGAGTGWALTPQEVWSHWTTQAETFGIALTATVEAAPGGGLTLGNVTYSGDWGGFAFVYTPGTLTLSRQDDGAVAVDLAETSSLSFRVSAPGEPVSEGLIGLSHPAASLVVSQEGDRLREQSETPQMDLSLESLTVDGVPVGATADYTLADMSVSRTYTTQGSPEFWSELEIATAEGGYTFEDPASSARMSNTSKTTGLKATGELALGTLLEELDLARTRRATASGQTDAEVAAAIGRVLASGFRLSGTVELRHLRHGRRLERCQRFLPHPGSKPAT